MKKFILLLLVVAVVPGAVVHAQFGPGDALLATFLGEKITAGFNAVQEATYYAQMVARIPDEIEHWKNQMNALTAQVDATVKNLRSAKDIKSYKDFMDWHNRALEADGVTSGSGNREGVTGETTTNGLEFTIGYSFKLVDGILRLPAGIGMSLTDEYQYYHDSAGNTGWYGNGELEDKKFIVEAGLQPIIIDFLYLSATYRLIGFSKSGFTIGAGFIL